MSLELHPPGRHLLTPSVLSTYHLFSNFRTVMMVDLKRGMRISRQPMLSLRSRMRRSSAVPILHFRAISAALPSLDLTEDNVRQVLDDARLEFSQIFDTSVGITGDSSSLRGRFWHKRSTVLARLANYLKQRIPEILEVDIEDDNQLDDSPENF